MYTLIITNNNDKTYTCVQQDYSTLFHEFLNQYYIKRSHVTNNYSFVLLKNGLPFMYCCTDDLTITVNFHLITDEFPEYQLQIDGIRNKETLHTSIFNNLSAAVDFDDKYWDVDTIGTVPTEFKAIKKLFFEQMYQKEPFWFDVILW